MPIVEDPFYARKPVPDAFIKDVGDSGLTAQEEWVNRERKYSTTNGGDVRKFSNPVTTTKKGGKKEKDSYYQRKKVPDSLIQGVGVTGLTPQEEFLNRERKYSLADGSDARRFSNKNGLEPASDPYYRKPVSNAMIAGIGETGNTQAEDFEVRDRKQSLFQLSDDPFAQVTGHHRQSVSGPAYTEVAVAGHRRKSSAIGPDATRAAANHHSGYDGDRLAPIESRADDGPSGGERSLGGDSAAESSANGNGKKHVAPLDTWEDPDAVGPHDIR